MNIADIKTSKQISANTFHSPMRYPAGKAKFMDNITGQFSGRASPDACYVEPFVGGGSTLIGYLNRHGIPRRIVLNDKDHSVASVWRCVQKESLLTQLIPRIMGASITTEEYRRQKPLLRSGDTVEAAFAQMVRGWCSAHNGVWESGPRGAYAQRNTINLVDKLWNPAELCHRLMTLHTAIGHVMEVYSGDFAEVITKNDHPNTVLYIDPPYYEIGRRFYRCSMNDADHVRLANAVQRLRHSFWVVNYYDHLRVRELYHKCNIFSVFLRKARRRADGSQMTNGEILIAA